MGSSFCQKYVSGFFANTFQDIEDYIQQIGQYHTKPEFEVYEAGMLSNIQYFIHKCILKTPVYIQFVLGIMDGIPATVNNLNFLVRSADEVIGPGNYIWSCAAAGRQEFDLCTTAVILGANARVGLRTTFSSAAAYLPDSTQNR